MDILRPPPKSVSVRMYRQGLGDCFLLAFATDDPVSPYYVLIDCGVILGTPNPQPVMKQVANDILKSTEGTIHLLVATHQHWDHLSGFTDKQAGEVFEQIKIYNIWLAWTEDPADPLAQQLRAQFSADQHALSHVLTNATTPSAVAKISALADFCGEFGVAGPGTQVALEKIQNLVKLQKARPAYLKPGDGPLYFPVAGKFSPPGGVCSYVLGPPYAAASLKKINPSKSGSEVYTGDALTEKNAFLAALYTGGSSSIDPDLVALSSPFEDRLQIPYAEARVHNFFSENYGIFPGPDPSSPVAWRRIDDDWLSTGAELALQMDSYTNNTSLVLAFELIESGKVLLFVGDAQVGNWLSWQTLKWNAPIKSSAGIVTAEDLLNRTVLYKVGHHGSHNATLKSGGLESMTSADLVAMVPVDEHVAQNIKGWKKMPYVPLMDRLKEKTKGRLIRLDTGLPTTQQTMSESEWQNFQKNTNQTQLYIEIIIEG